MGWYIYNFIHHRTMIAKKTKNEYISKQKNTNT